MKAKILKRDFDAAMAIPWATHTCLIAQAISRVFKSPIDAYHSGTASMGLLGGGAVVFSPDYSDPTDARDLQEMFDAARTTNHEKPDLFALSMLREALPIEVEFEKVS